MQLYTLEVEHLRSCKESAEWIGSGIFTGRSRTLAADSAGGAPPAAGPRSSANERTSTAAKRKVPRHEQPKRILDCRGRNTVLWPHDGPRHGGHHTFRKTRDLDEVTHIPMTFLTTAPSNDAKICQTHPQWLADGSRIIFRSTNRAAIGTPQIFAVHESDGAIRQLTHGAGVHIGSINLSRRTNRLFYFREGDDHRLRTVVPEGLIQIPAAQEH